VRAAEEGRVVHIPELSNQHTGPFAAVGTPQRVTMNGALPPQESNRNLFIAIGAGVVVLLVGIALIFGSGERGADDTTPPTEAKAAQPVGSEGLPKNRATIKANIEGASVHVDGEFQCKSPCEITVPVGDNRPHEIRLTLDGYIDVVQNWRPLTVTDSLPPFPDLKPISPVLEVKSPGKKRPG
jgi:hypothetical protein